MGVTKSGENEEERKSVLEAAHEEKMSWPTLLDPEATWWAAADVGVAPTFLVYGKDGRLVYRHTGKLTKGSEGLAALEGAVEKALWGS
jgi:hypothetical protein